MMNIANRIKHLRKTKGVSQDQLAESIGISRQAVSKWESEQSFPDIEKVILLSDYFEVTTDYLLKGIEPNEDDKQKFDSRIFSVIGTAVNLIGVFISIMLWVTKRADYSAFVGMCILAIGCAIMAVGYYLSNKEGLRLFLITNVWIVLFIPISMASNFTRGFFEGYYPLLAPYPELGNSLKLYIVGIIVYFIICGFIDLLITRK